MSRIVIIGGGAIGLSVAYHLAKRGADNILLLERNQLTSGTSWHAAGIVGPLRATANMTRLAMYALELFPQLERETGLNTGYKRTGGYWLARVPERMDELHRIASIGKHFGLEAEIVSPDAVTTNLSCLDLSAHVGALRVAEDAHVNPVDLCMAYASAARSAGVDIRENTTVTDIRKTSDRVSGVELGDGTTVDASQVVLCAGAWSRLLADRVGLALPLQPVEHMYVVTDAMNDLPDPFPVIRDLDTRVYIKGDAGRKLIIGGFEPDAKCWNAEGPESNRAYLELPEDWDQFMPFMQAALTLIPALEQAGIQRFMNGPESFTADTRPLVGQAPTVDGLYVVAGMNSVGIMSSAGIGRVLADWMLDDKPPMDLWEVDVARCDPASAAPEHMQSRMQESVADLFSLHWPFKQPTAGRGLRKSCLHQRWAEQGAVFGMTGGWERGLWYAEHPGEQKLPYSTGVQAWQPIIEREAAIMKTGACLVDLSPFSKFNISGIDATVFLNNLACARTDINLGRVVYTPLLNEAGGIEADVTISRLDTSHYRLTSGAATRWRDAALLRRRAKQFSVTVEDVTEREAVLGVFGTNAKHILDLLGTEDWNDFPFSTARSVTLAGVVVRATRLSFVGEPGWELGMPVDQAALVFDALIDAGVKPMGHYAVDSCRVEKGYLHWGHDIGPDITPLEAGLGFTIDWDKEFVGKAALLEQAESGLYRRLCLLHVEGTPLLLHDEPIIEAGEVVGMTTSGTHGARTGLSLAFGLISVKPGESFSDTSTRRFTVQVAGQPYRAKILLKPPFDPASKLMRS